MAVGVREEPELGERREQSGRVGVGVFMENTSRQSQVLALDRFGAAVGGHGVAMINTDFNQRRRDRRRRGLRSNTCLVDSMRS